LLRNLPADRTIIVVGERDGRPGAWPGRDGAVAVAAQLTRALDREVRWALPPAPHKDVRDWVIAQKQFLSCADAWVAAGDRLEALLVADARPAVPAWQGAPLPLDAPPPTSPFPTEMLPDELASYVSQLAAALNCPEDFVAVPLLAIAGAAL